MENRRLAYICLNLISAIILLVGLGSAVLIYQAASDDSNSVSPENRFSFLFVPTSRHVCLI
jgi:hypothetical protein